MAKNIVTLNLDNTDYTVRPYAICRTAANVSNKIITCNGFNLTEGSTILVKFENGSEINRNITLSITYNDADAPKIRNIPVKISNRHKYLSNDVYYEFIYRDSEFVMLTDNDFLSLDGGQLDGNVYIPNQKHGLYMGYDGGDFDIYQEVDSNRFKTAITPSNILLKDEGVVSNIYTDKNSGIASISIGEANTRGLDFSIDTGIKLYTENNSETSYINMNYANNYIRLNNGGNITSLFNQSNKAALTLENTSSDFSYITTQLEYGTPSFKIGTGDRQMVEIKGENVHGDYKGILSMNNISMFSMLGTGCLRISGEESYGKKHQIEIIAQNGKLGIFPTASTSYAGSLGNSNYKWESVYCKDLYGTASSAKILVDNEYKSLNIGGSVTPIYFANGIPVECDDSLDVDITGNAATASKLSTNAGNINTPVYFSNGAPVACDLDINNTYEVTYNNLMNLKNSGKLAPGKKYRIIDYTAAASGRKTWMTVAGNKFDIILEAISTTTLSENAKAIHAKYPSGTSSSILDFTMQLSDWTNPTDTSNSWWTEIKNDIQKLAPNIYAGMTDDSLGEAKFSDRQFSKGKTTVTFQYQSGNRDVHCLGVVVLNGNQIVAKDMHIGTTGHANNNNVYSLDIPTAGSYQIRMYVDKWRRSGGGDRSDMDATCKLTVNHINDYFANCELQAWDIKYCVDHMPDRFQWAPNDTAEYKGIIYYMKDEFGNEANYDFKNIKMDGYYTFDYKGNDGSVVTNRVWNNKIALQPNLPNLNIDLSKCYFKNTSSDFICTNNTIEPNCQNIIFGNSCDSNTIRNYCENITMGNYSSYNDIDTFCKNITTGDYFQSNTIGKNCETIACGSYFVRNKIGNRVSSLNFYKSSTGTTKFDGVHGFVIGDKSNSLTIRCTSSSDFNANTGNYVQYFNIPQNSTGTITIDSRSQSEITICVKESSSFKQYKLADAFGVKVEDATNEEIIGLFDK